jgi:nucleotide-binding universal stress UspA family protein
MQTCLQTFRMILEGRNDAAAILCEHRWAVKLCLVRVECPRNSMSKADQGRAEFPRLQKILLPTDFSGCAGYALPYAAQIARATNATIICVHVVEPVVPSVGYTGLAEPMPIADISEQLEDSAERQLPKLAECEECNGLNVEEIIVHGDAAAEIVRVAEEREVDLIVISSHGRTGLGRMIFGSTAEAVVRHAACPVLVVKPPREEDAN